MLTTVGYGTAVHPDRGYELFVTATVMVIIAGLFVAARVAVRLSSKQVGSDDYTIVLSLILSVALTSAINLAVENGYGMHKKDLTKQQLTEALRWYYLAQIFYKLVLGLNKVSILLLYLRVFLGKTFQWLCFVNLFVVVGWTTGSLFATIFQCVPTAAYWDKSIPHATCINSDAFWYAYCIINILTDVSILALPIREVMRLQLSVREKIGLMLIFLLGAFVTIVSIARTNAVANTTKNKSDITWSFILRSVLTLIEANTGIICACLPLFKRPLTILFPGLFRSTYANGSRPIGRKRDSYPLQSTPPRSVYTYPTGITTSTVISTGHSEKGNCMSQARDSQEDILPPRVHLANGITRKTDFSVTYHAEGRDSLSSLPEEQSEQTHL